MIRAALLALAVGTAGASLSAARAEAPPAGAFEPTKRSDDDGARRAAHGSSLDDLFARLAKAGGAEEAKGIAGLIERRLARSGSDTADLLLSRSGEALKGDDAALAVELLDRVTRLKPDWAEAWSRRAAAFFMLDDTADALADLHKALACEPRLYEGWAALGHIEMGSGNKASALRAFRRALALHPYLDNVREMVDRLASEVDGRDL
jgi:tetratricopeptide (TPR) repeat protein